MVKILIIYNHLILGCERKRRVENISPSYGWIFIKMWFPPRKDFFFNCRQEYLGISEAYLASIVEFSYKVFEEIDTNGLGRVKNGFRHILKWKSS